jgi:hypothetical protein
MTSTRKHKRSYYKRMLQLPLGLIATSDALEASARRTERDLGLPFGRGRLYYILKGRRPLSVPFWKNVQWMQAATHGGHRTTLTIARSRASRYTVSTIFLGLDHDSGFAGAPVLFETMAFARRDDAPPEWRNEQYRYRTWTDAIRGHRQLTARLSTLRAVTGS